MDRPAPVTDRPALGVCVVAAPETEPLPAAHDSVAEARPAEAPVDDGAFLDHDFLDHDFLG